MAPQGVPHGTPFGTKNSQKSSAGVPWEGLGRHLRNSCKKRAPLEGRTCNPLMPVQSKHSFQCSDFSYFWHQICPTLGSSWEHLPPKFTKVPLQRPPQKPLKNHFKITSKIDANGGYHFVGFWWQNLLFWDLGLTCTPQMQQVLKVEPIWPLKYKKSAQNAPMKTPKLHTM